MVSAACRAFATLIIARQSTPTTAQVCKALYEKREMKYFSILVLFTACNVSADPKCMTEDQVATAVKNMEIAVEFIVQSRLGYENSLENVKTMILLRWKSKESADSEVIKTIDNQLEFEFQKLQASLQSVDDPSELSNSVKKLIGIVDSQLESKPSKVELNELSELKQMVGYKENL